MAKETRSVFRIHIWFPEEFKETIKKLDKISLLDEEVLSKANKSQLKSGLRSLAIRKAIEQYIELNEYMLIPTKHESV